MIIKIIKYNSFRNWFHQQAESTVSKIQKRALINKKNNCNAQLLVIICFSLLEQEAECRQLLESIL